MGLTADIIAALQASPLYAIDRITDNEWSIVRPVEGGAPVWEAAAVVVGMATTSENRSIGDGGLGGEERAVVHDHYPFVVEARDGFVDRRATHVADLVALLRGTVLVTGSAPLVRVRTIGTPTPDDLNAPDNYWSIQQVEITRRTRRLA